MNFIKAFSAIFLFQVVVGCNILEEGIVISDKNGETIRIGSNGLTIEEDGEKIVIGEDGIEITSETGEVVHIDINMEGENLELRGENGEMIRFSENEMVLRGENGEVVEMGENEVLIRGENGEVVRADQNGVQIRDENGEVIRVDDIKPSLPNSVQEIVPTL